MRLFDVNGALNMGLQKRPFLFTAKAPFSWDPAAPPSGREPGEDGVWCGGGGDNNDGDERALSKEDLGFALERVRETRRFSPQSCLEVKLSTSHLMTVTALGCSAIIMGGQGSIVGSSFDDV